MDTFIFLLVVWHLGGHQASTFVLDYGLTQEDCTALEDQWVGTLDQFSSVTCKMERTIP